MRKYTRIFVLRHHLIWEVTEITCDSHHSSHPQNIQAFLNRMGPIIQSQKVCLHSVRTKTHMLSQVSHVYDVLTTAPARACTKFLWENNILSVTGRSNAGKIGTISLKLTVLENKVIFAYKICLQLNIHSKNLFRRLRNGEQPSYELRADNVFGQH